MDPILHPSTSTSTVTVMYEVLQSYGHASVMINFSLDSPRTSITSTRLPPGPPSLTGITEQAAKAHRKYSAKDMIRKNVAYMPSKQDILWSEQKSKRVFSQTMIGL